MVAVGAHHIGQGGGVTRIGLGARGDVAFPVAGHRQGVHGVDAVAGGDQRRHPQTPVGLYADDHLAGLAGMLGHQAMQLGDSRHPLGQPTPGQHLPGLVHDRHVVVVLGPVVPQKALVTDPWVL